MDEIIKLLYDYSVNVRLVDKAFIEKFIGIIVSKRGLKDYVTKITFNEKFTNDSNGFEVAAYNPFVKNINISLETSKILVKNRSIYDFLFEGIEVNLYHNLIITQYLLHEIEHADQYRRAEDIDNNDVETILLRSCMQYERQLMNPEYINRQDVTIGNIFELVSKHLFLYNKFYRYNPMKLLAQARSYETIIAILREIRFNITKLYDFANTSYLEELLKGYRKKDDFLESPTKFYLYGVSQGDVWRGFDFYCHNNEKLKENVFRKYNLFKRLSLGLPISYIEYLNLYKTLYDSDKFSMTRK